MVAINPLTSFNYFKWESKFAHVKPYVLLLNNLKPAGHEDFPETNFDTEEGPEEIVTDMRDREAEFSLDAHGFAVRKSCLPLGVELLVDDAEGLRMLKDELRDAIEIFFFDWRMRSNNPAQTELDVGTTLVHMDRLDQSPRGAINRVLHHMGDRVSHLLKGRTRNFHGEDLWRPLVESVEDCLLAVCDGSSVPFANCLTADFVRQQNMGESIGQTKDILMLKMYDSDPDALARCNCHPDYPHAAFYIRDHLTGAAPRESIKVRALVFSPPVSPVHKTE
ncbi:putative 7 alpha-cephem-methoxylase [Podospora conica]|nr:putative 7 alpha-cephem-methoxylase [Schizothecium conicum]